ncbi:HD domain-containing phosphohydrolase [Ramlibacter albus]|uniref:PAS domain S-box protein n=1 Tax=Ramlibacter albus TaxID=2079448 RepID=A0A923S818_9BURK|nr:HD domain-containing phosphohydrolase [Ramlibacter albus]MBC5767662.1 PAS domain S-box protein [Ramlibacter albus]
MMRTASRPGEREQALRMMIEASPEAIVLMGEEGRVESWNPAAERIFGYPAAEIVGKDLHAMLAPPRHEAAFRAAHEAFRAHGEGAAFDGALELSAKRRDGSEFPIELALARLQIDGRWCAVGFVRDISRRRERELALARTDRALRTLSACNACLVRERSEGELLLQVVRAIHETGGYPLAFVDCGPAGGGLRAAAGRGLARSGEAALRNAMQGAVAGAAVQVCRSNAGEAVAVLPLGADGREPAPGVLVVLGEGPAFDEPELRLLAELAEQVGYGIANLRAREQQAALDERVRVLARLPEEDPGAVMRVAAAGTVLYANPAAQAFLRACGCEVGAPAPAGCHAMAQEALAAGAVRVEELALAGCLYQVTFAPVPDAGYVNVYARDVTAQRDAERELERSRRRLMDSLVQTIDTVARAVEKRDPYTAGHQHRVAQIAVAIAREMGLPPARVEGVRLGAMVHDIGKIYVPAEILSRPGKLLPAEYELIRSHAQVGYDIMAGIDFPWPVAEMIVQHHERLDGSGYPAGLKGDEIVLEARILAVADVVEAMAAFRPYRPALGIDAALQEVESRRGQWFDAQVVDACVRIFRERNFRLPAQ